MSTRRTYALAAKLALTTELVYRANFLFGRLRELLTFASLFLIYRAVPAGVGAYSQPQLYTYLITSTFVSALIMVFCMEGVSDEIADGMLTNYLVKPVNYFWYWVSRVGATRGMLFVSAVVQVALLAAVFRVRVAWPGSAAGVIAALVLFFGAIVLVQLIDLITGLTAFWSHHTHAPRWLVTILIQFLSGAYIPIDALPRWAARMLLALPFPSLMYAPVKTWVGALPPREIFMFVAVQWAWIFIAWCVLKYMWAAGTKSYEAYGR